MFFLGAAFILLETKSIVAFGLLFGSTWMVNSLVFFAILTSVLARHPRQLAAADTTTIGSSTRCWRSRSSSTSSCVPSDCCSTQPILRYVVAAVMAFTPVFIANVVFARSFRDSETADIAFGSNLLGIMAGGTLEYFALLLGYRALLLIALGLYMTAGVARSLHALGSGADHAVQLELIALGRRSCRAPASTRRGCPDRASASRASSTGRRPST